MICEGKSIDKRSRAHVIRNTKTATDPCCAACKTVLTIDNNVGRVWPSWELFGFLAKREDHYVFMMSWCPLRTMTLYSFYTNTFKGFWWTLGTVISPKMNCLHCGRIRRNWNTEKGTGYDRKFESTSKRCCHLATDFTNFIVWGMQMRLRK